MATVLTEKVAWHNSFQGTSFGGIPMAQYWCDVYLWEAILNENPHVIRIIELGTWMGGFSFFLAAQAKIRDMDFCTYDSIEHFNPDRRPPNFFRSDIFAEADKIGNLISAAPTILFCDNGNKPREVKTFAPYLTNDSILVVHDWMTETLPTDIPDYLEELYGDFCDDIGSISRVFRKKVFH